MPGKGKSKGKKRLKKKNTCERTEQEEMPASNCGSKEENVLAMPMKEGHLATQFSSILDDLKNNNKVILPLEHSEESRGRDIVHSLLQAAIKKSDQEDVRRKSNEEVDKDDTVTGEELQVADKVGCDRDINQQQRNLHGKLADDDRATAPRIETSTSELCEEASRVDLNAPGKEDMLRNGPAIGTELEFLLGDEVGKCELQKVASSEDQSQLRVNNDTEEIIEGFADENFVNGGQDNSKKGKIEVSKREAEVPAVQMRQGIFVLSMESGKESLVKSETGSVSKEEQSQWTGLETASAPELLTLKHPLQHEWTFWHLNPDKNLKWSEKQKEIMTVGTVEDFWAVYNWTLYPSQLRPGSDYSLFKAGIRPDWEDERNVRGGRWMVIRSRDQLDHGWREIAMALVGETLGVGLDERVTGAVVNVRGKMDKIGVWVGDNYQVDKVGERLREVLGVSDRAWGQGAEYRRHK